jgi:hypothetical protein
MSWNCGTILNTTMPTLMARTGMLTARMRVRPASSRRAMMTPPTIAMGAAAAMVQAIRTNICTCCTSFVMRVMSEGAPKCPTSWAE